MAGRIPKTRRIGSHKWSDGMPKGNGISDPTGKLGAELAECKIMVAIKMVEIQVQKNKLIKYIDTISDSLMRQIVFYRCVACLNWSQVAAKIGESEDAIKKKVLQVGEINRKTGVKDNVGQATAWKGNDIISAQTPTSE